MLLKMDGVVINDVLYKIVEDIKGYDVCDLRDFCDKKWTRCIACDIITTGCKVFKIVDTNKEDVLEQTNNYFY